MGDESVKKRQLSSKGVKFAFHRRGFWIFQGYVANKNQYVLSNFLPKKAVEAVKY